MHKIFSICSRAKDDSSPLLDPLPAVVADSPFKSLEFWCIVAHDRKTLVDRISPYMVAHLPQKYLIRTMVADCGWSCNMFSSRAAQTEGNSVSCWRQVVTEFWENPRRTTETLLLAARAWFYTLLRYTYRKRFSTQGKRCASDPIVGYMCFCTDKLYTVTMSKRDIHRLTGIPKRYGATFYRSCYKDVRQSSDWKDFRASILWFCKSIQFPTYSDCPEQILEELGSNIPSVILQQRWLHATIRLAQTSALAADTANDVKTLDERVTCGHTSCLKQIEELECEIRLLRVQCKRLYLACEAITGTQSKEFRTQQNAWGKQLECLRNTICKNEAQCNRSIAALTERLKKDYTDLNGANASSSLESLVACRWLLENLPDARDKQRGFGSEWRSFWQLQWSQCEHGLTSGKHPLHRLKGDERYNRAGKNLYGTLSNTLHGYGHLRNVSLHPDVQTLVDTIGPVHYKKDKRIDIEAERRRWLVGTKEIVSKKEVL